ncbi:hypothetical protein WHZ77_16900 [Bradyrhizobium sp. A5]|uniref:hypothetical protein n=1 Tax=Bradyrhizobium sp. A5 TaxID=3133696 RepID=UPI003243E2B8
MVTAALLVDPDVKLQAAFAAAMVPSTTAAAKQTKRPAFHATTRSAARQLCAVRLVRFTAPPSRLALELDLAAAKNLTQKSDSYRLRALGRDYLLRASALTIVAGKTRHAQALFDHPLQLSNTAGWGRVGGGASSKTIPQSEQS